MKHLTCYCCIGYNEKITKLSLKLTAPMITDYYRQLLTCPKLCSKTCMSSFQISNVFPFVVARSVPAFGFTLPRPPQGSQEGQQHQEGGVDAGGKGADRQRGTEEKA